MNATTIPTEPDRRLGFTTAVRRFMRGLRIMALDRGYWSSIRMQKSIGENGSSVPWYTYPCIEYLDTFHFSDKCVFEFGAGGSSEFWARRARNVVSVDDNPEWHATLAAQAAPNQRLILARDESSYVRAITESGQKFDVVAVDGAWRRACAEAAIHNLAVGGMIILDNSDRSPEICAMVREKGFFQVDFNGPGPINPYCWTTSVFIRATTTLQAGYRPAKPTGGLGVLNENR